METLKASGLPSLPVPVEFGGGGLAVADMVEVTCILARGNPSIAQMYAVHVIEVLQAVAHLAAPALKKRLFTAVVEENAFLANASSERHSRAPMSWNTKITQDPAGKGIFINGEKFYSTGSAASDFLYVPGLLDGEGLIAFVPTRSQGVELLNDWRSMGQRGTSSGTTLFKGVFVPWDLVVRSAFEIGKEDSQNFFAPLAQSFFSAVFLGTAQSALEKGIEFVKTKSRPWSFEGVQRTTEDPYIIQAVGRMSANLAAAEAMLREAARVVDDTLKIRETGDSDQLALGRAEAMVTVAKAKVVCTDVALQVCVDVFKICGTRAAMAEEDFDRFLRDVRTLTLHDPVEYKAKLIGDYYLGGKYPFPSFVS
jgi:alkylation response protein AidB-like acyl-CoA dehydrogenase